MNAHTPADVRRYDLFKLVVALVLSAVIVILLLRGGCARPAQPPPAPTETATAIATAVAAASATPEPVTAPTIDTPVIPDADGHVTLGGTGAPGSTLQIVADGEVLGEVTVGEDGGWTWETNLPPGGHRLQVRALDDEGAVVAESETVDVAVATPKPIAAPTMDTPAAPDAQGRVRLSGSGAPGSTLQVVADGEVLGEVTVGEDGDWALDVDLPPGDYRLQARALDDEGTVVAESETMTFSRPEPALIAPAILAPTEGAALTADVVELSGTGTPGAEIEVLLDGEVVGSATVGADGAWTLDQELPSGEHSLAVRNTDDPDSLSQPVDVRVEAEVDIDHTSEVEESEEVTEPESDAGGERVCGVGKDRGDTYVVARCEYMALIASRTGVRLADLIAVNPQVADTDLIYPGQVLNLPPRE